MSIQEHSPIIYYKSTTCHDDSLHHSTTMNGETLHTCEASENGKECWHHAEIEYRTTAHVMGGVYYPSETHWLCKQCYDHMWDIILDLRDARVQMRLQDQGGRVA